MKGPSMWRAVQFVSSTQLWFFHPSGFQLGDVSAPRALPGLQRVCGAAAGRADGAAPALLPAPLAHQGVNKKDVKNASRYKKE